MPGFFRLAGNHASISRVFSWSEYGNALVQRGGIALEPNASSAHVDLIVDSTGLSVVGQGEWATTKRGKRGSSAVGAKGAKDLVPPVKGAVASGSKLPLKARDKSALKVNVVGQRESKKESGNRRQGCVESAVFHYM